MKQGILSMTDRELVRLHVEARAITGFRRCCCVHAIGRERVCSL